MLNAIFIPSTSCSLPRSFALLAAYLPFRRPSLPPSLRPSVMLSGDAAIMPFSLPPSLRSFRGRLHAHFLCNVGDSQPKQKQPTLRPPSLLSSPLHTHPPSSPLHAHALNDTTIGGREGRGIGGGGAASSIRGRPCRLRRPTDRPSTDNNRRRGKNKQAPTFAHDDDVSFR